MPTEAIPAAMTGSGAPAGAATREQELKLQVPAAAAEQVRRSRPVRVFKRGRAVTRHLLSVYFDTPDQALRRNGLTLRVRHIGARRIQTVKAEADQSLGLAVRREWETDISGDVPEPAAVGDPALRHALARLIGGQVLQPVFESDIRRTAWLLQAAEGSRVELALDIGCLAAGNRRQPVHEVELEVKEGPPAIVFDIAADLNRTIPFAFEARSKADRGFALAGAEPPPALKAKPVPLDPQMSAQEAFVAIAGNCLAQAEANEACALDGRNAEGVHQLRVACRRLRSAFSLFRPILPPEAAALSAEVKWFAGEMGEARDWDVFLAETLAPLRAALPEEQALESLQAVAERCRVAGYDRARTAIGAPRYTAAKLALRRWLADRNWHRGVDADAARLLFAPVVELADLLLERRARKLRRLGRRHDELSLPELHEMRIRGKKLRYATEFFGGLHPGKRSRRYAGALAQLQDVLGVLNDSVVAHNLLERAAAAEGADRQAPGGLDWYERCDGILAGWYAAQTRTRLQSLAAAWKAFARQRRFWEKHASMAYGAALQRARPVSVAPASAPLALPAPGATEDED